MRWVWQEEHAAAYVNELSSGDGATFLDTLMESSDFDCMIDLIKSAINTAATAAGVPQRPLIPGPSKPKPRHCATTPWYNEECVSAQSCIKHATCALDLRQAVRGYRLVVRRAKRSKSRAREAQLIDLLKHKPKLFWQAVKHSPAAACTIGMQKYFEYCTDALFCRILLFGETLKIILFYLELFDFGEGLLELLKKRHLV